MLAFSEFQVTFSIAIAVSFLEGVSLQYIYIFFFFVWRPFLESWPATFQGNSYLLQKNAKGFAQIRVL